MRIYFTLYVDHILQQIDRRLSSQQNIISQYSMIVRNDPPTPPQDVRDFNYNVISIIFSKLTTIYNNCAGFYSCLTILGTVVLTSFVDEKCIDKHL